MRATLGCSPKAVFLSHVNEVVRVRVGGAVVLRSLHVCGLSLLDADRGDGLTDSDSDDVLCCVEAPMSVSPLKQRPPCLPLPSDSLIKALLSVVTSCHLYLLVIVVPSVLAFVTQQCHLIDPHRPMAIKKIHGLLQSFTLSMASSHSLQLSLPLLLLPWLALSITASQ